MLIRNILVLWAIALGASQLVSCNLFDREEDVPSYLRIDSIQLVDNPDAEEGSLSHDILDSWVYIDDELVGIFKMPCEVPILDEGEHTLLVGPGIKVSAISDLRDNYLFYGAYETTVTLKRGEILPVTPVVQYRLEGDVFEYDVVEDFEDSFLDMSKLKSSQAELERTIDPQYVYEGNGSGIMFINDTTDTLGFRTTNGYAFPQLGSAVYLELDYRTDYHVVIGLQVDNGNIRDQTLDYVTLRPTEGEWKKAYIALTSVIASASNFQSAYVFFVPEKYSGAPESGVVVVDNVKLMVELE